MTPGSGTTPCGSVALDGTAGGSCAMAASGLQANQRECATKQNSHNRDYCRLRANSRYGRASLPCRSLGEGGPQRSTSSASLLTSVFLIRSEIWSVVTLVSTSRCFAMSVEQLQDRRHFALDQEIDLQIEIGAKVRLLRESILAGEHEQRQEDRLERHHHRQQLETETDRTASMPGTRPVLIAIHAANQIAWKHDRRSRRRDERDAVAEPLDRRSLEEQRAIPRLDRFDVFLDSVDRACAC